MKITYRRVLAGVLLTGAVTAIAPDAHAVPTGPIGCPTEDYTGPQPCRWDALTRGNGYGRSFDWTGARRVFLKRQPVRADHVHNGVRLQSLTDTRARLTLADARERSGKTCDVKAYVAVWQKGSKLETRTVTATIGPDAPFTGADPSDPPATIVRHSAPFSTGLFDTATVKVLTVSCYRP